MRCEHGSHESQIATLNSKKGTKSYLGYDFLAKTKRP